MFHMLFMGELIPNRYDSFIFNELVRQMREYGFDVTFEIDDGPIQRESWSYNGYDYPEPQIYRDFTIIRHVGTGKFVVIDQQDSGGAGPGYQLATDPDHIGSWFTMYSPRFLRESFPGLAQKSYPAYFLNYDIEKCRSMRQEISDIRQEHLLRNTLDERLYFSGTQRGFTPGTNYNYREVLHVLNDFPDEVLVNGIALPDAEWWRKAATHRLNLVLPGHPWCSREHELWCLGLPFITYRFDHFVVSQPIPNHDYVAVEGVGRHAPTGVALDREEGAYAILDRFREVRRNHSWLEWIGKNGQMHYKLNLTPQEIVRRLLRQILYVFERDG